MKALIKENDLLDFSYTFDTLTIYPKCDMGEEGGLRFAMTQCNQLVFVMAPPRETKEGEGFNACFSDIKDSHKKHNDFEYDRFIHRDDHDHNFYHKDHFPVDNDHFHLKFKSMLTRDQFETVLNIFASHDLISPEEKRGFLTLLDRRYQEVEGKLNVKLTGFDQQHDGKAIINYVATLGDNDVLADLHHYLLHDKFEYLRRINNSDIKKYCGENDNGKIVTTSKIWAMIEKSIALQMEKNIKENVTCFSIKVGKERAQELQQFPFFAIKRALNSRQLLFSKNFKAFDQADEKSLDQSYNKHFRKFSM